MTMDVRARYMLVGVDDADREHLTTLLRPHGDAECVASMQAAEVCLRAASDAPDGLVIGRFAGCPDAEMFALVTRVREAWPAAHLMLLTAQPTRELIHCAAAVGAQVASTLPPPAALGPFISRTTRRAASVAPPVMTPLEALAERCALSRREVEVLACFLSGVPQTRLAASLDMAPKTLANHVHRILAKTGHATLLSLAVELLVERHEELDEKTPVTAAFAKFKRPTPDH